MLYSRCLGDLSFANLLLEELESKGHQHLRMITRHAEDGDALATAEAAHALKGAAAILGATSLCSSAAQLETAGREGRLESLLDLVHQLRGELMLAWLTSPACASNYD